jgi:hypothetical protein
MGSLPTPCKEDQATKGSHKKAQKSQKEIEQRIWFKL